MGAVGFLSCCCFLFLPIPLAATVTGGIALAQINKEPERYKGKEFAIAGIALGGLILALVVLANVLQFLGMFVPPQFNSNSFGGGF